MKTVRDLLQEADPLRHESHQLDRDRDRRRHAVVAAASDVTTPASRWLRPRAALAAAVALIGVGIVVVGSQMWRQGGATLQAQMRFEVRLAEDQPGPGLREARIVGSDDVVYLHQEILVTNDDIAESRVVEGDGPSRFGVSVQFNAAGAHKMREGTASRVGRLVATLIDGEVIAASVLRSPISTAAISSGDYTRIEAEAIVDGIGIR